MSSISDRNIWGFFSAFLITCAVYFERICFYPAITSEIWFRTLIPFSWILYLLSSFDSLNSFERHCANPTLLFAQAIRFTFKMYVHLQHRHRPLKLHTLIFVKLFQRPYIDSVLSAVLLGHGWCYSALSWFWGSYTEPPGQGQLALCPCISILVSSMALSYLFQASPIPIFSLDRSVTEALFIHLYSIPSSTRFLFLFRSTTPSATHHITKSD